MMHPRELALLYLEQLRAWNERRPAERPEPNALYAWEDLIVNQPEAAWPVFHEILTRVADDETIEQVWYRLRILLYRHYNAFAERAEELVARFPRLGVIAGPGALDASRYREKPFDREKLIEAYRAIHRTHHKAQEVDQLIRSDPHRALGIAVEIIHRGVARGWTSFDLMTPLNDLLAAAADQVLPALTEIARESVAVRRVLWRLKRHLREHHRVEQLAGTTTDYTELDVPPPRPQPQLDADEAIIEAWFENEENFWSFSAIHDLCDDDPPLAWSITLQLIERAEDRLEVGAIAAGPLEDLIRKHPDAIWPELVDKAYHDPKFLDALRGVWIFPDDGDVHERFEELMQTVSARPN